METGQKKSFFGSYGGLDLLSWMRSVALDPCFHTLSNCDLEMHRQVLNIRKFMVLSSKTAPRRKRKLELFLKAQSKVSSQLPSLASPVSAAIVNSVDSSKSSNGSASSLTCEDNFDGNKKKSSLLNKNDMIIMDSDASLNGSKGLDHLPTLDFDESVHGSCSSGAEDQMNHYLKKPRRSIRLQNFVGDYIPTMVIPVGPCFQANIPEWTDPSDKRVIPYDIHNDSESLKWLGVRIWPIKTRVSESRNQLHVGRGRADSCSCVSPGSGDCIKRHVLEQRRILKTALGSAFHGWKFDEMGEEVAKSWSSDDQEKFRSFMKSATSNGGGFWKNIFRFLPSKRSENIVSYYFNVYIRRSIIMQPQRLLNQVGESDGASNKYLLQKHKRKKSKGR